MAPCRPGRCGGQRRRTKLAALFTSQLPINTCSSSAFVELRLQKRVVEGSALQGMPRERVLPAIRLRFGLIFACQSRYCRLSSLTWTDEHDNADEERGNHDFMSACLTAAVRRPDLNSRRCAWPPYSTAPYPYGSSTSCIGIIRTDTY